MPFPRSPSRRMHATAEAGVSCSAVASIMGWAPVLQFAGRSGTDTLKNMGILERAGVHPLLPMAATTEQASAKIDLRKVGKDIYELSHIRVAAASSSVLANRPWK